MTGMQLLQNGKGDMAHFKYLARLQRAAHPVNLQGETASAAAHFGVSEEARTLVLSPAWAAGRTGRPG